MADSFEKRQREKRKQQKRREKEARKRERKEGGMPPFEEPFGEIGESEEGGEAAEADTESGPPETPTDQPQGKEPDKGVG